MYKEKFINILLIIQLILFLFASATGIAALFFGELLPFACCLICDVFICRNVIMLDDIVPRTKGLDQKRN